MVIYVDLDGTIYRSNTLIPGSKYAINKLIVNNDINSEIEINKI